MDLFYPLVGFAFVHLLAVASPGPTFLVVARTAAVRVRAARPGAFVVAAKSPTGCGHRRPVASRVTGVSTSGRPNPAMGG